MGHTFVTFFDYAIDTTFISTSVFKNTGNLDTQCFQQLKLVPEEKDLYLRKYRTLDQILGSNGFRSSFTLRICMTIKCKSDIYHVILLLNLLICLS